ncbi:hypothetical protein ACHAXT_001181 [Thalassiosira profunda]
MGGLVKKIRLDLSTRHRRKKASAATVRAVAPSKPTATAKAKKRWEFTLPSHPKAKRAKDAAEVPQKVFYAPTEDDNNADDGYAGITELFGGWLASLTSCFGLYVEGAASATSDTEYYTTDDSGDVDDDDWSDESTQPSLSMLNRVLKLPARPDDVSDITSAASISIDDSESFSTAET